MDSTFYAIPPAKMVRGWAERTPPGFSFALKLPQEITHERRLRDAGDLLVEFLEVTRELGADNRAVYVEWLGIDDSELARLRTAGVV